MGLVFSPRFALYLYHKKNQLFRSAPNTLLGSEFRYPFNPLQNHLQKGAVTKSDFPIILTVINVRTPAIVPLLGCPVGFVRIKG